MMMGVIWRGPTGGYRLQVFSCLALMFQVVMLGKFKHSVYCQIAKPKVKRYNLLAHVCFVLINFPKEISQINIAQNINLHKTKVFIKRALFVCVVCVFRAPPHTAGV